MSSIWGALGQRLGRRAGAVLVALFALCLVSLAGPAVSEPADPAATETRLPVTFSGGHETDPQDRGRPVALIAAALGVPPEVFRETFRHVHPAPAGTAPDPEQVRQNKAALMAVLSRYGVTNERLDTVSNYYRYNRSRGELWPTEPATAYALVKGNKITGFVVTQGGSGYSSPPTVTLPGGQESAARVQLSFSKQFEHNGCVAAILLPPGGKP